MLGRQYRITAPAIAPILLGKEDANIFTGNNFIKHRPAYTLGLGVVRRVPVLRIDFFSKFIKQLQDHVLISESSETYLHGENGTLNLLYRLPRVAFHAEGCDTGEMKHGSLAMIDSHFPTVAIATSSSVYEKIATNIEEIKSTDRVISQNR